MKVKIELTPICLCVLNSLVCIELPDDGSLVIRNMLEQF